MNKLSQGDRIITPTKRTGEIVRPPNLYENHYLIKFDDGQLWLMKKDICKIWSDPASTCTTKRKPKKSGSKSKGKSAQRAVPE